MGTLQTVRNRALTMSIPKREAELKSAFTKEFKRQHPGFMTLFLMNSGAPDRALVGLGRTSFWEFKHATPDFSSPGNQELFCIRLAASSAACRYVLWWESAKGIGQRTMIVHPGEIKASHQERRDPIPEDSCTGFNHRWLANYVWKVHHG